MVLAEDLIDATQNLDAFVSVSGALRQRRSLCPKWPMISGCCPAAQLGFAEINLPPKQNGSSIMPGKINPVIPRLSLRWPSMLLAMT